MMKINPKKLKSKISGLHFFQNPIINVKKLSRVEKPVLLNDIKASNLGMEGAV